MLYFFVLIAFFISGCSHTPDKKTPVTIEQTPQQRAMQLAQLQQWQVTGKIAFIEKTARNSASLFWQVNEQKQYQQLNLTTYLGINILQLESDANNHEIQVDGKTYQGTNLEALIYSITGLTLPTKALTYWLKGITYQNTDNIIYDEITLLPESLSSEYNNEVWQVSYANYQSIKGYSLATTFSIKKDDLLIKIIINDWSIVN
ncbi:lipoprotein insertase outer membrane protein LolB [Colwellia sp. E2M01]|uniref:lipoprotein insertase outer membrane protein LolB n=1 Tax=Colwellia sp. E2M01 TaxID=2841561 RepID=UPI002091D5F0|nr:lipoprotein insertase outer membrane protein LolB [Colwellia sp. E2M01]